MYACVKTATSFIQRTKFYIVVMAQIVHVCIGYELLVVRSMFSLYEMQLTSCVM